MPRVPPPNVITLAGPNGAGKSTVAAALLAETLGVSEFVNADVIACGLSGFNPEGANLAAGRVMLQRLRELAERRESFAFETTLASRSFAPWVRGLIDSGYRFHLVYLWLPDVATAIARVAARVERGGHDVPEEMIRRRYRAGLANFFQLYQPLASHWRMYDNSNRVPRMIAAGVRRRTVTIVDENAWSKVLEEHAQ